MTKSLANEPVGDDERDAIERCPNDLHYRKECDDSMFKCGANLSWREGFVHGRKGMVPKSAVEEAVKAERNRIIQIIVDRQIKDSIRLDYKFNVKTTRRFWEITLTPTNQGEKE